MEILHDLSALARQHPTLQPLIDMHREILEVQSSCCRPLNGMLPRPPDFQIELENGVPLVSLDWLVTKLGNLDKPVSRMEELLARYGVGEGTAKAMDGDGQEVGDPGQLLDMLIEAQALHAGPIDPPYAVGRRGLALGQVIAGVLRGMSPAWLDEVNLEELWQRGYCPLCGSWPDLSLVDKADDRRSLACSMCDSVWPYRRVGCPFCQADEGVSYFAGEDDALRLYVCETCGVYLKTVMQPAKELAQTPLGKRILLLGLDIEAEERGYRRIPLVQPESLEPSVPV